MTKTLPETYLNVGSPLMGSPEALSFPHLRVQWHNGNQQLRAAGGVHYHGGFVVPLDVAQNVNTLAEFGELPGFAETAFVNRDGDEWRGLATRRMTVAVVMAVMAWQHGRSRTAVLGLLGRETDEGEIEPVGPVLIRANSWTGGSIVDAVHQANTAVAEKGRQEYDAPLSLSTCWVQIGTFGEIQVRSVGKDNQSPITPCQFNADFAPRLVEEGTLTRIVELQRQATPWFESFQHGRVSENGENGAPAAIVASNGLMPKADFYGGVNTLLKEGKVTPDMVSQAAAHAEGDNYAPAWAALQSHFE